jgi:hypothetical protein
MTLKLYFAPGACSFVPHTLLEASGAPFEPVMVKLHKGEQNSPAFRAVNPRGQVPVLVDGDAGDHADRGHRQLPGREVPQQGSCRRSRWRAPGCWRRWPG